MYKTSMEQWFYPLRIDAQEKCVDSKELHSYQETEIAKTITPETINKDNYIPLILISVENYF